MPELPEVETIRRQLAPRLVGRRVLGAESFDHPKFTPALELVGVEVTEVSRRGKYLLLLGERSARGIELSIHLGMTGSLRVHPAGHPAGSHQRARWRLDHDQDLVFDDTRRFGRLGVSLDGARDPMSGLARLGPEPWDESLDGVGFWRALQRSRRPIKTQLLSQVPIAGVGNIYADEALWAAGIDPRRRRIGRARSDRLLDAIRSVLALGIRNGGTTLRDYVDADGRAGGNGVALRCYGRSGSPCDRCGSTMRRIVVDARGTTFCPTCQR